MPFLAGSARAALAGLAILWTAAAVGAAEVRPGSRPDSSRIVSVGGAITEILYALGLEQRVVAVDSTSFFPPRALADKPNVGYMRQLSAEGILGLSPSLVLAAEDAGPKETIAVLKAANVPFVQIPDPFTGEGIVQKVRLITEVTGAESRGACLAQQIEADLAALAKLRKSIDRPPRVAFVLSLANNRPNVAGRATAADGIIKLAGAVNAMDSYEGYKLVNDEAMIAARPDAVLVMQRDSHPLDAATVLGHPAFATSPAAERKAFISMGGLYLLGFGPRTARAARDLAAALSPAVSREGLPSESAEEQCK